MRLLNRGSDKKGVFNFDCFGFVVKRIFLNCKNDFLNFLKRSVLQPFFQKLKGVLVKVGLSLSFGCMRLNYRSLGAKILALLNKALKRFLKLNQRSVKTKPNPLHRLVLGA